ncbi:MAG TPA: transporter substrate-binding domain-containing protein [Pseudolabrys sp.]|nr:transporter substrate-binding domain-containing protein [Pseudolabrys sp.]
MPFPFRTWALIALLTLAVACPASAQQQRRPPAATPQRPAPPAPPAATPQLPVPQETPGVQGKLADPMAVPSFWDPRRRPERPDLTRITIIRFLTETDYPPFNFTGADGTPAGFNVDLARMICEEMKVPCTVQQRRFDTLIPSLNKNEGDAIIASLAETTDMRRQLDFSEPYYRTPARFVSRRDVEIDDVRPQALEGKKIAVVAGTAHEAYLKTLFTEAELHPYPTDAAARFALKRGEVDLLFGDGVSLAFWLNGTDSSNCCVFRGGPFLESKYFGDGVGIAVKKGNDLLRQAFNWALFQLWDKGRFTDLWLRYFPVSPF